MPQSKATFEQKTEPLSSFNFTGLSEVEFIKDIDHKIVLIGDQSALDNIIIDTSNGVLQVKSKNRSKNDNGKVHVQIYAQNIESLEVNATGILRIPNQILNSTSNKIAINAVGSVSLKMDVDNIDCDIAATASVNIEGRAKNGKIRLSAVASLDITKFQKGSTNIDLAAVPSINF